MDPDAEDHYAALGVRDDAPADKIEEAWKFGVLAFHPDRFREGGQRERAEQITKRLNAAWQTLGDPVARARYDRTRRNGASSSEPREAAPTRSIPCPTCSTVGRVPDHGGRGTEVRCSACGERFRVVVGAHLLDRPRLSGPMWRLRFTVPLGSSDGRVLEQVFRKMPQELSLAAGETVSVVFAPKDGNPRYLIRHAPGLDMGWRVD